MKTLGLTILLLVGIADMAHADALVTRYRDV